MFFAILMKENLKKCKKLNQMFTAVGGQTRTSLLCISVVVCTRDSAVIIASLYFILETDGVIENDLKSPPADGQNPHQDQSHPSGYSRCIAAAN